MLEPPGQGAARHRWRVLVIVMVPVFTVAVAGVVVSAGASGVMLRVAIVSCPVSETISPAPTPAGLMTKLAFLAACDPLVGLKTTLMSQLCPGAIVAPAQPGPSAGGAKLKLARLQPATHVPDTMLHLPWGQYRAKMPSLLYCMSRTSIYDLTSR